MLTLSDLLKCFQLYAVCEPCQRVEGVDLPTLVKSEGGSYPIDRVRMRLYCKSCEQRSQALRIVYVGPDGKAASFRYAR
jgi:hypothetical protein